MGWLAYSLVATLSLGTAAAMYKLPAKNGHSSLVSTFWANTVAALTVLIGVAVFGFPDQLSLPQTWHPFLVGASFAIIMALTKTLMKDIDVGVVFPVTSALSAVGTIAAGIIILGERLSWVQSTGVAAILLSTYLFTRKGGAFPINPRTIALAAAISSFSILGKYWQRQGVVHDEPIRFLLWQLLASSAFSLILCCVFERKRIGDIAKIGQYWKGSALIGLFTALGGAAIVQALHRGPMAAVYAIHPSYILISGFLGAALFNESISRQKVLFAALSVVGVILVKIG